MSTALPPDGTPFYFTQRSFSIKAPNNGIPIVDPETVTNYAGLTLRYAFYRGTLKGGKISQMETWNRTETELPGSFLIGTKPLESFEIENNTGSIRDQKARFFMHDATNDTWNEVDHAKTEGHSDFIRVYLVAVPDSGSTIAMYERIAQRLTSKISVEYDANGTAQTMTEAFAVDDFEPVTRQLPQLID